MATRSSSSARIVNDSDIDAAETLLEEALNGMTDVVTMIRGAADNAEQLPKVERLQELQRRLVLLSRDASDGAARLYTLIRRAQQPAVDPDGRPA